LNGILAGDVGEKSKLCSRISDVVAQPDDVTAPTTLDATDILGPSRLWLSPAPPRRTQPFADRLTSFRGGGFVGIRNAIEPGRQLHCRPYRISRFCEGGLLAPVDDAIAKREELLDGLEQLWFVLMKRSPDRCPHRLVRQCRDRDVNFARHPLRITSTRSLRSEGVFSRKVSLIFTSEAIAANRTARRTSGLSDPGPASVARASASSRSAERAFR
jgi:hypothetical protein